MKNFWVGFEKQAGVLKQIGRATGFSQLKTQVRAGAHAAKRNQMSFMPDGRIGARPDMHKRFSANSAMAKGSPGLRAAGTVAAGGAGLYAMSGKDKD